MQWLSQLNEQGIPCGDRQSGTAPTVQIYSTILGCLCGMWPLPLDWAKPWQVWPTSVMIGAICGSIAGYLLSIGVFLAAPQSSSQNSKQD
mmetsp:Transcript_17331/g.44038  ORF Transcript_17331/g.44038 Transcript_17331/m.44038 type:complete len:90 (+) Transcript_17331:440-709(+)